MLGRVQSSEDFVIDASIDKVRGFFSVLKNILDCIPGCEEVIQSSPMRAQLKIKVKLGYVSKTLEMDVSMSGSEDANEFVFTGNSEDAEIHGKLTFDAQKDNSTKVTYSLEVVATSSMARTALAFMGKDFVNKQTRFFADCVTAKIKSA
jgi:carbon monoxide dehydrogenase subunit G